MSVFHGDWHGKSYLFGIGPSEQTDESSEGINVLTSLLHIIDNIIIFGVAVQYPFLIVVSALKSWENKELVEKALRKILDVHERYEKFSAKSYEEAEEYLRRSLNP